jgi:hypothetical protein
MFCPGLPVMQPPYYFIGEHVLSCSEPHSIAPQPPADADVGVDARDALQPHPNNPGRPDF